MDEKSKEVIPIYNKESEKDEIKNPSNPTSQDEQPTNSQVNPNQGSESSESSSKEKEAQDYPNDTRQTKSESHNSVASKQSIVTSAESLGRKSKSGSLQSKKSEAISEIKSNSGPLKSQEQFDDESIGKKSKSGSLQSQQDELPTEKKSKSLSLKSEKLEGTSQESVEKKSRTGSINSQNLEIKPSAQKSTESEIPAFCSEECVYEGNRCHAKRFAYYLETGLESDVTIVVGENKNPIKAHKLILMIGSPVLRKMLCEDRTRTTYEITDIEGEVFMLMLEYLYTGDAQITDENALPLLEASEKYRIPDLGVACSVVLKSTLSNDNTIPLFQQARKFKNLYLENATLDIICKNASKIVESDDFLQLETQNLGKVLEQDNLAVFDELQLFDAVLRWAKAECKRKGKEPKPKYLKTILKPIIHLIRFPQMESGDFSMKVADAGILGVEELVSVLLYYNVKEERKADIPSGIFNPHPRKYFIPSGDKYIIQRLRPGTSCYCSIPMTNSPHSIKLKVSKSIWISSIGLNKPSKRTCTENLQFKLKVEDFTNKKIINKKKVILANPSELYDTYHLELDKPVHIKEGLWHVVSFRIGQGNYYGRNYESVDMDNSTRNRQTSRSNNNNNKFNYNNVKDKDEDNVGTALIHYHCKGGQDVWFHFEDVPSASPYTNTKMGYLPEFAFQIE